VFNWVLLHFGVRVLIRQSGDLIIRSFEPTRDRREVERLWSASLAASSPIVPQGLDMLNDGWLAEHDGRAIGLTARSGPALQFLVVSPGWRRKGLDRSYSMLRKRMHGLRASMFCCSVAEARPISGQEYQRMPRRRSHSSSGWAIDGRTQRST
jgi:hypothetical protein